MGTATSAQRRETDRDVIDRLLTTTRSVRRRLDLDRPVPHDLILECISVAMQAPMGGNRVRARWIVVDDAAVKAAIAEIYRKAYAPYIARAKSAAAEAGRDVTRIAASSDHLASALERVPALVFPCQFERPSSDGDAFALSNFYGSIIPATWSFMLALRVRGIGSSYTTLHLQYEAEVAQLLDLPEDVTQACMIPIAYFTGSDFRPVARPAAFDLTYWNGWKRSA